LATLSLRDALPICRFREALPHRRLAAAMKDHRDYADALQRVETWLGKNIDA
jgi:hypothetical protein